MKAALLGKVDVDVVGNEVPPVSWYCCEENYALSFDVVLIMLSLLVATFPMVFVF